MSFPLSVRRGRVLCTDADGCWVRIDSERCVHCTGRCAIALGGAGADRELSVARSQVSASRWPPQPGAAVTLAVGVRPLRWAVAQTFGLPLAGLLAGAGAAEWVYDFNGGGLTVLWALAGLLAAGLAAWLAARAGGRALAVRVWCDTPVASDDQVSNERNSAAQV